MMNTRNNISVDQKGMLSDRAWSSLDVLNLVDGHKAKLRSLRLRWLPLRLISNNNSFTIIMEEQSKVTGLSLGEMVPSQFSI
jgi:hypothetical protein